MDDSDQSLGMYRDISRRDLVNGVALAALAPRTGESYDMLIVGGGPAFLEAHRAEEEVLERRAYPFIS